jgi:protein-S-isoprenylcysteine O-methyltransferase Ste14
MTSTSQRSLFGAAAVFGLASAEVLIMASPFAGLFYSTIRFEPFLGLFSQSPLTAWLDGFFLQHSVVTSSVLLEWQRKLGTCLFGLGLWGFFISAFQVYGNKLTKRGVAKGLLYRFVRHPQYLCLGLAGLGLLTIWPRFLLLGIWTTMLFLYAGLARFEEYRMEERFGEDYRDLTETRGIFLPGSPVHSLFEKTFGRIQPRLLGWAAAYLLCLILVFSGGFVLRAYTRASTAILFQPERQMVVVSAWPQPKEWIERVVEVALADREIQQWVQESQADKPVVATILPPRYEMKAMFYKASPDQSWNSFGRWMGLFSRALIPPSGFTFWDPIMGVDPDSTNEPVQVVFSQAEKAYKKDLALEEALDASVRLKPLVVVDVVVSTGEISEILVPLPQNRWGPNVVMPLF